MTAASMRREAPLRYLAKVDWGAVSAWSFAFLAVVYLGLEGGGYDPLVHDRAGIAVWWILLAGTLAGALPRRRQGRLAWTALGLLAAFAVWTAVSLGWTESPDRTWAELARVATYMGFLALALFARGGRGGRLLVGAVGAGIACVALVALLSRLHPAWFPEADQTARFLVSDRERLSFPLNYWNALAALIAIGTPLLLQAATCARSLPLRALAAGALPVVGLVAFLTLSRGGIAAGLLALAVFLAFVPDRLPKALTLLVAAAGAAGLIAAASARDAFQMGLVDAAAEAQGDQMVPIVLAVCLAVGAIQAGISLGLRRGLRPGWAGVTRRQSLAAAVAVAFACLLAAAALDAPGRAGDAWDEFKGDEGPGGGPARLASAAGQSRYELWGAALDENAADPLTGTGAGAYEFWWNRNGGEEVVRDAHSLYLQTLGELGIVGILLLGAFLLAVLLGGGHAVLRAPPEDRAPPAAALAGCVAFCFAAVFDWMWQVPVLPVAFLLLAAVLVGPGRQARPARLKLPPRVALAATAAIAIAAIAVPLATTSLLRESEADARDGDLGAALEAARSAKRVQPGTAGPRLQEALVLEEGNQLTSAAAAARAATEREPTNWRNWFVLSRIEAERGMAASSVRAFRRARSLNPHFSIFRR
jgi:hypothetical protein